MDDHIFENMKDNTETEKEYSELPRLREPAEILEFTPPGELQKAFTDTELLSNASEESGLPREGAFIKLAGRLLALLFCTVSLFLHSTAAKSVFTKTSTEEIKAFLENEIFANYIAFKENDISADGMADPIKDDTAGKQKETEEKEPAAESFPIEKADLSVSEKNAFSLNNQTRFSVKTNELTAKGNPCPEIDDIYEEYGNEAPCVLIIHTHGTEAYTDTPESYTTKNPFRSTDPMKNVIAVGEVMTEVLREAGINVIHDKTMYDKESYRDSYNRSRAAVSEHLEKNPSIAYIFDVHRDAIIREDKTAICPVGTYNDLETAQVMTVVGTDQDGADHKDWRLNLSLALTLQTELVNTADGIARSINLRTSAFNQGLSRGYLLLEIGSCANTLVQAKRGAVISASALTKVIKNETHPTALEELMEKYAK